MKYLVPPTAESQAALVRLANMNARTDALAPSPIAIPEEECVKRFGAALSKSGSSLAKSGPAAFVEDSDRNDGMTPPRVELSETVGGDELKQITTTHLQDDRSSEPPPLENLTPPLVENLMAGRPL
jgi:hypothetical protein